MARKRVEPIELVTTVCAQPGNAGFLDILRTTLEANGVVAAVGNRDPAPIYDWLMIGFSMQGVSNAAALGHMAAHGNASYHGIAAALADHRCPCPKLAGFEQYVDCGYVKAERTCNRPSYLRRCPVPRLPLRKGALNQLAFALYFFIRDRCGGDVVGFIDDALAAADVGGTEDRHAAMRAAVLEPFAEVHGVSAKLVNMMLATLLLAGGPERPRWFDTGRTMIAVDSLVHNFLHRTGILDAYDAQHRFGAACTGPNGCRRVLYDLAARIDCQQFNAAFPSYFPRFVQYAIWAFCAADQHDVCNGNNIDDRYRCDLTDCPVYPACGRVRLTSGS